MELNELNLNEEQMATVQKYVQSETDKVRTDYSKKLKDANDELSKYKPIEKTEAEKALEERLKALEDKEKDLSAREKSQKIAQTLKSIGLPEELANYINVGDDIDKDVEKVGTVLGNYFLKVSLYSSRKDHLVSGDEFRRIRLSRGLSLADVAKAAGITKNYISMYENFKDKMSEEKYEKILKAVYELESKK